MSTAFPVIWNSGQFSGGSGSGAAFTTIQTPNGTYPVATGADPLTLTSTDSTVTITGNSSTDTVNFAARVATATLSGIVSTTTQSWGGGKSIVGNADEIQLKVTAQNTQNNALVSFFNFGGAATFTHQRNGATYVFMNADQLALGVRGASGQTAGLLLLENFSGISQFSVGITGNAIHAGSVTATSGIFSAATTVTGSADAVQLKVKAFSTQTNVVFQIVNSANSNLFSITNAAQLNLPGNVNALSATLAAASSVTLQVDQVGLTVTGVSGQTNHLQDWKIFGGTVKAYVSEIGAMSAIGQYLIPSGTGAGNTGELRFLELVANGTNYVGFKAPDNLGGNVVWTLPSVDGSAGQVLKTDGSAGLSWVTAGAFTITFPMLQGQPPKALAGFATDQEILDTGFTGNPVTRSMHDLTPFSTFKYQMVVSTSSSSNDFRVQYSDVSDQSSWTYLDSLSGSIVLTDSASGTLLVSATGTINNAAKTTTTVLRVIASTGVMGTTIYEFDIMFIP